MKSDFWYNQFIMMNEFSQFSWSDLGIIIPLLLWVLFWKGSALWFAVKGEQKFWFWIILILNTFGALEIIFIFFVAQKKWSDIKEIFSQKSKVL